jgi:hypothetical protein
MLVKYETRRRHNHMKLVDNKKERERERDARNSRRRRMGKSWVK